MIDHFLSKEPKSNFLPCLQLNDDPSFAAPLVSACMLAPNIDCEVSKETEPPNVELAALLVPEF